MKRVLFIASVNPFLRGGGPQAIMSYCNSILELFGESNVDVMIPDEAVIPEEYTRNINYIRIKIRGKEKYMQYFKGYLSRFTKPLVEYLTKNKSDYSICIINGGVTAGLAVKQISKLGIKTVVIHHNNEIEYHLDNKTTESLRGKFVYAIKKIQGSAYKNANLNLFLTNQDIHSFSELYGQSKGINRLLGCYETKSTKEVALTDQEKDFSISISGTLADYQTTSGILDFYTNHFNFTKKIIPSLTIVITGKDPSNEIIQIQKENADIITIVPNPENIYEIVQKGEIYLCPTNIGGGLKLRAMDGLKCGLPILIHKVSSRGYDYFFDKPYFKIYDDEKSFEAGLSAILSFINSKNYNNIKEDFQSFFGFKNGTKRIKDAFLEIIDEEDLVLE